MTAPAEEPVDREPAPARQPPDRLVWTLTTMGIVAMLLACGVLILIASFR